MFEHSLQNRKVICFIDFFGSSPVLDAGDAMIVKVERKGDTESRSYFALAETNYVLRSAM